MRGRPEPVEAIAALHWEDGYPGININIYIRHYTTLYDIYHQQSCCFSKAALLVPPQHFLQSSSIIFHHLTLSSIILSSFHIFSMYCIHTLAIVTHSQPIITINRLSIYNRFSLHNAYKWLTSSRKHSMQPCTGGAEISKLLHTFRTLPGKHFSKKTWQ